MCRTLACAALLILFATLPASTEVQGPRVEEYYAYLGDYLKRQDLSRSTFLKAPETVTVGESAQAILTVRIPENALRFALDVAPKFGVRDAVLLVQPFIRTGADAVTGNRDAKTLRGKGPSTWVWKIRAEKPGKSKIAVELRLQLRLEKSVYPTSSPTVIATRSKEVNVIEPSFFDWLKTETGIGLTILFLAIIVVAAVRLRRTRFTKHGPDDPQGVTKSSGMAATKNGDGDPTERAGEPQSVAEIGVSDAALHDPKDDLIGTSRLAKGLSLFLSHKKTNSPLTIAITGPWGSGKSSIMGMLQTFLRDSRYRPVWFNVWHHQDEEHFFGALLENIRKDAIPPLWHFSGVAFRARLLLIRLQRRPLVLVFLGLAVLLIVFAKELLPFVKDDDWITGSRVAIGFVTAFSLADKFAAFGFSSKDLYQGLATSFKSINFKADAGLRYRVRQCLQDIDAAMGNRSMVIIVDDLDRCPADHVLKVLEVVNFLSAPPLKFFVIFGISLEKVVPIISPTFARQVEEEFPAREGQDAAARTRQLRDERLNLARQYLRKMINIEVSVPAVSAVEMQKLANENAEPIEQVVSRQDRANARARRLDQTIFPGSVAVVLAAFLALGPLDSVKRASQWMSAFSNSDSTATGANGASEAGATAPLQPKPATGNAAAAGRNTDNPSAGKPGPEVTPKPDTEWYEDPKILLIMVVLIVIGVAGALRRENRAAEIGDSNTFLKALDIWAPVLNVVEPTPRHYIRVLNQLRLLSMRMRIERKAPSQETDGAVTPGADEDSTSGLSPEDTEMVHTTVLTALRELEMPADKVIELGQLDQNEHQAGHNPDHIESRLTATFKETLHLPRISQETHEQAYKLLAAAVVQHREAFPGLWPAEKDMQEFDGFMKGLQLS